MPVVVVGRTLVGGGSVPGFPFLASVIAIFSGAQLHSTVPNTTNQVRWSIDFRTVNLDDVVNKRGAPNRDSASTGTSLRDFLRVADFAPVSDGIVAAYDDGIPVGGVAVFKPEMTNTSAS